MINYKTMNVLSLFDGISCGQLALQRAGIKVDNYFASEIDPHAIKIAQKNFPTTKHVGSVTELKAENVPAIDLLIGGSPCQSFSMAGNGEGFDGKSKLFWEYVRILKEVKPKYFLLENVKMKKEWEKVITDALGVEPIMINSALVSAQNRRRLYWTNIPNIEQPTDKGTLLRDILIDGSNQIAAQRGRYLEDGSTEQMVELRKDNLVVLDKFKLSEKAIAYMDRLRNGKPRWEYHANPLDGKAACLTANMWKGVPYGVVKDLLRRLTPIECERLQTLPQNYTEGVSDTQRYKMIGNGWTVDVIAHIFKNL